MHWYWHLLHYRTMFHIAHKPVGSQLEFYSIHLFSLSNMKNISIFLHLSYGKYGQK